MPVRNFAWKDLSAVLDFIGKVQAQDEPGRKLRRQNFKELLGQPGVVAPEENCLLLEEDGQILGCCLISPEPLISRAVLGLDIDPQAVNTPLERALVRQSLARSRELDVQVAHICLGQNSPRSQLLEMEGFYLARVYWDMVWQQKETPRPKPPDGFTIRSFRPGDAPILAEVQNAAFTGSWGFSPNSVQEIEYRSSMSNTSHPGILFLFNGAKAAGYCWTFVAPANGRTRGIIGMIGVAPDYRGRGVSKPILLAGIEYLKSIEVDDIGLHVDGENNPAIRLYLSAGFEKVGELHWYEFRLRP